MEMLPPLLETQSLRQIAGAFARSPKQINGLLESDAELLPLPDGSTLAITTDCIAEEISTGLYSDPAHIGWMTVVVNLSDLAAVGATPLGLLLSESLPPDFPESQLQALQAGIAEACTALGVYVLGGDTNTSACWQMGGTAIGIIPPGEKRITRKGAAPGHLLYASGPMGLGGAYAFYRLFGAKEVAIPFQPVPRLKEGALVRQWGSACMDTSDVFFHTLANLMEINGVGFQLQMPLRDFIHPAALRTQQNSQLPLWMFLAGPHGEFELLFTVSPDHEPDFVRAAQAIGWAPLKIGECTPTNTCTLRTDSNTAMECIPSAIANAFPASKGELKSFLNQLFTLETSWQLQPTAK